MVHESELRIIMCGTKQENKVPANSSNCKPVLVPRCAPHSIFLSQHPFFSFPLYFPLGEGLTRVCICSAIFVSLSRIPSPDLLWHTAFNRHLVAELAVSCYSDTETGYQITLRHSSQTYQTNGKHEKSERWVQPRRICILLGEGSKPRISHCQGHDRHRKW